MNLSPLIYTKSVKDALAALAEPGVTVSASDALKQTAAECGYKLADDGYIILADGNCEQLSKAKKAARKRQCKLILTPEEDFTVLSLSKAYTVKNGFAFLSDASKADAAAILPENIKPNACAVFGELAVLDFNAYELLFKQHMNGENPPYEYLDEIANFTSRLIEEVGKVQKDADARAEVLCSFAIRANELIDGNADAVYCSGAAQMYEALRMLFSAEKRRLRSRGETEFLVEGTLIDYYLRTLGKGEEKIPAFPPDNCRRIDAVEKYFGADLRYAALFNAPIYPPFKMRLAEYRSREFKKEFIMRLIDVKKRYAAAFAVFKRMCDDDGYSLKTLFDSSDISLCLALSPDVFPAESMLSFIKQTGDLEKFVL